MAGICCGIVGESETSASVEPSSRSVSRRRADIRPFRFIAGVSMSQQENSRKRPRFEVYPSSSPGGVQNTIKSCTAEEQSEKRVRREGEGLQLNLSASICSQTDSVEALREVGQDCPKFGMTSVCGRRRDMEDAVAIHPSFCSQKTQTSNRFHFYGVYDGHGCSHVALQCKNRMHELVNEEVENAGGEWKHAMERSYMRMDKEVSERSSNVLKPNCRCELQMPQCDAVGSTAVVAVVTPEKIIVSNCGDSRAVLCRNGVAVPLSIDHKPDRADELDRINAAGGRVIYWDGARVLGVLAMSRAIGDNYLKPFVIPEPEVTVTDRSPDDECLILASDGLWDVVSNDTACGVVRMCLRAQTLPMSPSTVGVGGSIESSDKACSDASILLTKLALARQSTDNVSVVVVDLRRERRRQ